MNKALRYKFLLISMFKIKITGSELLIWKTKNNAATHPLKTHLIIAMVEENQEASFFFIFQIEITGSELPELEYQSVLLKMA